MHSCLFGAGGSTVDADVVCHGFGVDVLVCSLVGGHQATGPLIAGVTVVRIIKFVVVTRRLQVDVGFFTSSTPRSTSVSSGWSWPESVMPETYPARVT
jgi:hypothetical protein